MSWIEFFTNIGGLGGVLYFLEKIINLLKSLQFLWAFLYRILGRFLPKPMMDDNELKKEVNLLISEISSFLNERALDEPGFSRIPIGDKNEISTQLMEHHKRRSRHSKITTNLFKSKYLQRVAKVREEFKRRGIYDERLEMSFRHPSPYLIDDMLLKFAEMSAKL